MIFVTLRYQKLRFPGCFQFIPGFRPAHLLALPALPAQKLFAPFLEEKAKPGAEPVPLFFQMLAAQFLSLTFALTLRTASVNFLCR